jgi:hypothetical protein
VAQVSGRLAAAAPEASMNKTTYQLLSLAVSRLTGTWPADKDK